MLGAIFLFELRQRLRRLSTWVYFIVFFALGLLLLPFGVETKGKSLPA